MILASLLHLTLLALNAVSGMESRGAPALNMIASRKRARDEVFPEVVETKKMKGTHEANGYSIPLEYDEKRIVAFNLDDGLTEAQMFEMFEIFGTVRVGRLFQNPDFGRFFIMTYSTREAAEIAINALAGLKMGERNLGVHFCPGEYRPAQTFLRASPIPPFDHAEIGKQLADHGTVLHFTVSYDEGCMYVIYNNKEAADASHASVLIPISQ